MIRLLRERDGVHYSDRLLTVMEENNRTELTKHHHENM